MNVKKKKENKINYFRREVYKTNSLGTTAKFQGISSLLGGLNL